MGEVAAAPLPKKPIIMDVLPIMTRPRIAALVLTATALTALPGEAAAPPYDTPATVAFMKDLSSGAILYSKNPDQRIPPASLAKRRTV